jgi:hypothetical protein
LRASRPGLDPDVLCADATRYHSIYGVYGISVFAVRGATVDELAQQVPPVRFDHLSLLTVRDVLAAEMRLEPTGLVTDARWTHTRDKVSQPACYRKARVRLSIGLPSAIGGLAERGGHRRNWVIKRVTSYRVIAAQPARNAALGRSVSGGRDRQFWSGGRRRGYLLVPEEDKCSGSVAGEAAGGCPW